MEPHGLIGRVGHGNEDRYPNLSRDWDEVDCKAVGCKFNRNEKCMVPSRCKIGPTGQCEGFEAAVFNTKVDGD